MAKIYPGDFPPAKIPSTPVNVPNLTTGNIDSLPNWQFIAADCNLIPGAAAASAAPYPSNILAVWAEWSSDPATYLLATEYFDGVVSNQTDCDS